MSDGVLAARLRADQLVEVAELERLCFAEPWSERSLELLLGDAAVGVAVTDPVSGRVIAYGGMMLASGDGQITNIAVHPSHRRLGAGRAVLRGLIGEAERRGLEQMSLEVRESNQVAIALYLAEGFQVAGKRKRFYRNPAEDALVMVRECGHGSLAEM